MELRRYVRLLRRQWVLVLITVVIGAVAGYLVTPSSAQYRTNTTIYVGAREFQSNQTQLYAEEGIAQVVATFAEMIPSPVFAQRAIAATGVPRSTATVVSETKATVVSFTNLISVSVTDRDPVVARELANGISNAFVAQIQAYEPGSTAGVGTVPAEPAYVFQDATLPLAPLASGETRNILLGGLFGLVAAVLLVLLLDYLDITIRSPNELERRLGLPVLGILPLSSSLNGNGMPSRERVGEP